MKLKGLFVCCLLVFNTNAFGDVCSRTKKIVDLLERVNKKDCSLISKDDLSWIPQLRLSGFSGNKISDLKAGDFTGFENLSQIDLAYNMLTTLSDEVLTELGDLPHLGSILIYNNPISLEEQERIQKKLPHVTIWFYPLPGYGSPAHR